MSNDGIVLQFQYGLQLYVLKHYSPDLVYDQFKSPSTIDWPAIAAGARSPGAAELGDLVESVAVLSLDEGPAEAETTPGTRRVNHYAWEAAVRRHGAEVIVGFCYYAKCFVKWGETHFVRQVYLREADGQKQTIWNTSAAVAEGIEEFVQSHVVEPLGLEHVTTAEAREFLARTADYERMMPGAFGGDQTSSVPSLDRFLRAGFGGNERRQTKRLLELQAITSRAKVYSYMLRDMIGDDMDLPISPEDIELLCDVLHRAHGSTDGGGPNDCFDPLVHAHRIWQVVSSA